jgi:hypothetical protein
LKASVLPAPVFYPGSIDRTSFAERNEKKGIEKQHQAFHQFGHKLIVKLLHGIGRQMIVGIA